MMEMLKFLRLAVCVACIAAFASGCGGGGGGGTADEAPVMECPQGQIGTYPNCMAPPPTDEERIETAQNTLAGIIADAQTREQAARADASAVEAHEDATEAQKTDAGSLGDDARNALTDIVTASAVANVATTGAQAEGAVADARTALNNLISAQQSLASLLSAVEAVANLREQQQRDEELATNGSSLIQHVRDNKLVYDDVLMLTGADGNNDPLTVGATDSANLATYPKDTGTGATRVVGERGVTITPTGATALTSGASGITTSALSGTGPLPHGFDLKRDTTFVNAYTDIAKTRVVRTRIALTGDAQYEDRDVADADYLVAGIWLASNAIEAFAYGSQPLTISPLPTLCGITETSGASTATLTRACEEPTSFSNISDFVADGKDVTATYRGDASGAYLADGEMSYFEADVTLNAEFKNPTDGADADNNGSIEGEVTNIVAAGKSIAGSIELQKHTFGNAIGAGFGDDAVGVVDGKSYSGAWKGQFFGLRNRRTTTTGDVAGNTPERTTTTTYSAQAPGSVAGTFYATQQSNPAGSTAFIGSFATHR